MKRNGILIFLACLLILLSGALTACADTCLIPCEVEGANTVVQYRQRQQERITLDKPTAYPGYAFLGREYGEWSSWSDWSATAAVSSAMMDVETREPEPGMTEYRIRTRTCSYIYGRWGDWSEWTEEALQENETTQVETQTFSIMNIPDTAVNVAEETWIPLLAGTGTQLKVPAGSGIAFWKSSAPDIAAVDATGYVTAKSAGEAYISANSDLGGNIGSIQVHVLAEAASIPENTKIIADEAFTATAAEVFDLRKAQLESIGSRAFAYSPDLELVLTDGMNGTIENDAFNGSHAVTIASSGKDSVFRMAEDQQLRHYIYAQPRPFVPVTGIRLNASSLTLNVGESVKLQASVVPSGATLPYIGWDSTSSVIRVDNQGLAYATRPGTATVYAYNLNGTAMATCDITVQNIPVDSIILDQTTLEMTEGDSAQLTAQVTPENATDPSIIWISQNTRIASVIDGNVTAHEHGRTVIEAKSRDGSEVVATCTIWVHDTLIQDDALFTDMRADDITATDATLYAAIHLTDKNPDLLGFYIGTDPEDLQLAAVGDTEDSGEELLTEISYNMFDWGRILNPDTVYYYRFYMTFGEDTLASEIQSFRTAVGPDDQENDIIPKGSFTDPTLIENAMIYIDSDPNSLITAQFNVPAGCTKVGYQMFVATSDRSVPVIEDSCTHPTSYYDDNRPFWFFNWQNVISPGMTVTYRFYCVSDHITIYSPELFFTCPKNGVRYTVPAFISYCPPDVWFWGVNDPDDQSTDTFVSCTQINSKPKFDIAILNNKHRIEISTTAKSGYGIFEVIQNINSEKLPASLCFRIIPAPQSDNKVTTRVAAVANVGYSKTIKTDKVFIENFNDDDEYGNDKSMETNAKKLIGAYSCIKMVGEKNTIKIIDPGKNMGSKLRNFFRNADDNDVSIIYVGGHGGYNGETYGTVLTDGSVFFASDYVALADQIPGIKVFIIDTCHSGALVHYFRALRRKDVCILSAHRAPVPGEDPNNTTVRSMPGHRGTYLMKYFLQGIGYQDIILHAGSSIFSREIKFSEICSYVATNVAWDTSEENRSWTEEKFTIRDQKPIYYNPAGVDPIIYSLKSR